MKDIYETPEVDIIKFTVSDIITTSIIEDEVEDPLLLIIFLAAFTITGCQANQNDNSDNDVQEIDENEAEDPFAE